VTIAIQQAQKLLRLATLARVEIGVRAKARQVTESSDPHHGDARVTFLVGAGKIPAAQRLVKVCRADQPLGLIWGNEAVQLQAARQPDCKNNQHKNEDFQPLNLS
jgi:hypothetical protein